MGQTWRRDGSWGPTGQGCATWGQPGEGGISPEMGQSSPGVMQGEVGVCAGLQQGAVLTP